MTQPGQVGGHKTIKKPKILKVAKERRHVHAANSM
jgi:hypothetical protein